MKILILGGTVLLVRTSAQFHVLAKLAPKANWRRMFLDGVAALAAARALKNSA